MRHGRAPRILGIALLALLAAPLIGLAQDQVLHQARKHKRYMIVDLGTFGGPNSSFVLSLSAVLNNSGVGVGGADTSTLDPPSC